MLKEDPNFDEKIKEAEKFKQQEAKRFEKVIKKEMNDWEDLSSNPSYGKSAKGINTLTEKLIKVLAG